MVRFFQLKPVKFRCTGCGKCCTGSGKYFVFLNEAEARAIQETLRISWGWFRRRYLARHRDSGQWVLRDGPDKEKCVFLNPDNSCKVYAARPLQCRTYPFWPEIMITPKAWQSEARRCEGIDQGKAVPASHILECLELEEQYQSSD